MSNIKLLPLITVPSLVLFEAEAMVTTSVGWEFNLTVKVAVPPASVVLFEIVERITPAVSSSVLEALTDGIEMLLYFVSLLDAVSDMV